MKMEREHFIDRLRVIAVLVVFVFHCLRFFDPFPWHLKNPARHDLVMLPVAWINAWSMELFFLLSGFGSWFALGNRALLGYLKARFLRLLLPVYTVGIFLLLPPQRWSDLMTNGKQVAGFLSYYPSYLTEINLNYMSPFFLGHWSGHLWFLRFLFMISILTLPLMLWLKSPGGRAVLDRLERIAATKGGIWWLLPLLMIFQGVFPIIPGRHNWAAFFSYTIFFVVGFVMAARPSLGRGMQKNAWPGLALGLLAFLAISASFATGYLAPWKPGTEAWKLVFYGSVSALNTWCWLVFILGMGRRYLNQPGKWLGRLNEAVLPFYILHQTIILLFGWWLGPLEWSIPLKLVVLALASIAAIILVYEILVRPWPAMRFLFGMKGKA